MKFFPEIMMVDIGILLIAATMIFVVAFFFLLLLLFTRLHLNKKSKNEQETRNRFLGLLYSCLDAELVEVELDLREFRSQELPSVAFLFLYYDDLLAGNARDMLRKLAPKLALDEYARKILQKPNALSELQMATAIAGRLQLRDCSSLIKQYSRNREAAFSLQAAKAGLEIEAESLGDFLVEAVYRVDWSISKCEMILRNVSPLNLHAALREIICSGRFNNSVRLIFYCGLVNENVALLQPFLADDRPVNIISAAIRSLNGPEGLDIIRRLALHESWVVRCQVARFLRLYAMPQDIPLLVTLLKDSQWWVKYRAAEALAFLPGIDVGDSDLRAELNEQTTQLLQAVSLSMSGKR